jgi:hypothetical protein
MLTNYVFLPELLSKIDVNKDTFYKRCQSRYRVKKISRNIFIDISTLERKYQVIAYKKCTNLSNLYPSAKIIDLFGLSKSYIANLYNRQRKNPIQLNPHFNIIKIKSTLFVEFDYDIITSISRKTCFRIENKEDYNYAIENNMTILEFGYTKIGFY